MGDHWTYALQIVQRMYMRPSDVCYFLEYPLINTWAYEIPFGPLCKSARRTLGLGGRPLLFRELVAAISYKYPLPLLGFHTFQMPPGCLLIIFVSV
jgi:hypothetical protein